MDGPAHGRSRTPLHRSDHAALIGIGLLAGVVALAAGILLAYNLARRLQRLAERLRPLTSSQLGQQVPLEGQTEVREFAGEFNALSYRLAASEQQRQQMSIAAAVARFGPLA